MNSRALAAKIIFQVLEQRQSLMHLLPVYLDHASLKDRGFIQEICYGVLRWLPRLAYQLQPFVTRKPKGKDKIAYHVMLVGLYQLYHMAVPHHAALHATVEAAHQLTPRLKKMVNAVLRHCLRAHEQQPSDFQTLETQYAHALWLIEQIKQSYPQKYIQILTANNTHPPMWIRVNLEQQSREVYQQQLKECGIAATATDFVPSALCLQKPHAVNELPGFLEGLVSVQDASAQLAAYYLDPRPGEKILDACAAPGGKSLHLLQHCPDIQYCSIAQIFN